MFQCILTQDTFTLGTKALANPSARPESPFQLIYIPNIDVLPPLYITSQPTHANSLEAAIDTSSIAWARDL